MARYLGRVSGSRGPAQRLGGAGSGLTTIAASWQGAVKVTLFPEPGSVSGEKDWCRIELIPWQFAGSQECLYVGPVSGIRRVGLTEAGKKAHHATHAKGKR